MDKKVMAFFVILVLSLLVLSSCADKEKQQMPQNQTPLQKPIQPMNQTSPCGDGTCDAAEEKNPSMCPQDCESEEETEESEETTDEAETDEEDEEETTEVEGTEGDSCTDDTDCTDGYYCKDDACTKSLELKENVQQNLYDQVDSISDRTDSVLNPFDNLYDFLESKESNMSEDDYEDIDDAIDTYYEEVEADIEDIDDQLNTLTGDVASLETADLEDFNEELNTIRESINTLRDEVYEAVTEYYIDIYDAIGNEGPDLFVRQITFSPDDSNEEGTFTITIKNVGNDDVDDEYEVEARLVIEGSTIDTCTEDGEGMESLEEEEISCDFDISEYYEELYDEEEESLDVELRIELDTGEVIDELNEGNNEVTYETSWTLETFE